MHPIFASVVAGQPMPTSTASKRAFNRCLITLHLPCAVRRYAGYHGVDVRLLVIAVT